MEIDQLKPILDDPRFEQFDFEDLPSLLDNDYRYQDFAGRNSRTGHIAD